MNVEGIKKELRKRTKEFAGMVVQFFMGLDKRAEELRVFTAKIDLCSQEADETQLWLELLRDECQISSTLTDPIWQAADELISIFVTMSKNSKGVRT